ncbi:MAG: hypothetical protein ACK5C3_03485 [bacterium]
MLSHACASCGKVLDDASRTYSGGLRMWIARCPRCGFAVRWAPRAAREPSRIWSRLRALNLRLGVAVASMQFAAVLLLFASAFVDDRVRRGFEPPADLNDFIDHIGPALVTAGLAGMLVGLCAATVAPFRKAITVFLGAWTATAVLLAMLTAVAITAETTPAQLPRFLRALAGRHLENIEYVGATFAGALVVSIAAPVLFRTSVRAGVAGAIRRAARARREKSVIVRADRPRSLGAPS